ncbi:hypothetical protein F5Y15DRAFT_32636 [Xylariaceae sp. FL0016]|nr:hypothetical protein F5Y15DRAFT_32636 [Xylariaceae sp. FL0016]
MDRDSGREHSCCTRETTPRCGPTADCRPPPHREMTISTIPTAEDNVISPSQMRRAAFSETFETHNWSASAQEPRSALAPRDNAPSCLGRPGPPRLLGRPPPSCGNQRRRPQQQPAASGRCVCTPYSLPRIVRGVCWVSNRHVTAQLGHTKKNNHGSHPVTVTPGHIFLFRAWSSSTPNPDLRPSKTRPANVTSVPRICRRKLPGTHGKEQVYAEVWPDGTYALLHGMRSSTEKQESTWCLELGHGALVMLPFRDHSQLFGGIPIGGSGADASAAGEGPVLHRAIAFV